MNKIVYARVIFYILSTLLAMLPVGMAGWGVSYDAAAGVVTISIEALSASVAAAVVASGAVFSLWGKK